MRLSAVAVVQLRCVGQAVAQNLVQTTLTDTLYAVATAVPGWSGGFATFLPVSAIQANPTSLFISGSASLPGAQYGWISNQVASSAYSSEFLHPITRTFTAPQTLTGSIAGTLTTTTLPTGVATYQTRDVLTCTYNFAGGSGVCTGTGDIVFSDGFIAQPSRTYIGALTSTTFPVSGLGTPAPTSTTPPTTPTPTPTPAPSSSSTPVAAIVGGVVGGIALCLIVFLAFCIRSRRRQRTTGAEAAGRDAYDPYRYSMAGTTTAPTMSSPVPSPLPSPIAHSPAGQQYLPSHMSMMSTAPSVSHFSMAGESAYSGGGHMPASRRSIMSMDSSGAQAGPSTIVSQQTAPDSAGTSALPGKAGMPPPEHADDQHEAPPPVYRADAA